MPIKYYLRVLIYREAGLWAEMTGLTINVSVLFRATLMHCYHLQ